MIHKLTQHIQTIESKLKEEGKTGKFLLAFVNKDGEVQTKIGDDKYQIYCDMCNEMRELNENNLYDGPTEYTFRKIGNETSGFEDEIKEFDPNQNVNQVMESLLSWYRK